MEPLQALNVLAQATGDPSLKLNRQDTHMVEEALQTLHILLAPAAPNPAAMPDAAVTDATAAEEPGATAQ